MIMCYFVVIQDSHCPAHLNCMGPRLPTAAGQGGVVVVLLLIVVVMVIIIMLFCSNTGRSLDSRGAGIAQLVVLRLAVHSVTGSILLWGHFPVEGIFPLELTWVQTPFPPKNSFG